MINNDIYSLDEITALVAQGVPLILAGDEKVLSKVPKGNWIGGTIPYFITQKGGAFTQEKIFATKIPESAECVTSKLYTTDTIHNVFNDAPDNGFSVIIIPASSQIHSDFALRSSTYKNYAASPLIGWISGVSLDELGEATPKVANGNLGQFDEKGAVVMHVTLPKNQFADIGIVNIFEQGTGDVLRVEQDGFSFEHVLVNGKKQNFATYLKEGGYDTKLPVVADFMGSKINTSFQAVNDTTVDFYAPLFKDIEYRLAKPVPDYINTFNSMIPEMNKSSVAFSCNCILNYLYAEMEGKQTGGFTGPITFGEVAYQLLNQTMVYLDIQER